MYYVNMNDRFLRDSIAIGCASYEEAQEVYDMAKSENREMSNVRLAQTPRKGATHKTYDDSPRFHYRRLKNRAKPRTQAEQRGDDSIRDNIKSRFRGMIRDMKDFFNPCLYTATEGLSVWVIATLRDETPILNYGHFALFQKTEQGVISQQFDSVHQLIDALVELEPRWWRWQHEDVDSKPVWADFPLASYNYQPFELALTRTALRVAEDKMKLAYNAYRHADTAHRYFEQHGQQAADAIYHKPYSFEAFTDAAKSLALAECEHETAFREFILARYTNHPDFEKWKANPPNSGIRLMWLEDHNIDLFAE